ncbi:MAG: hypothetical protein QW638_04870 [Candidatus Bathyarchaeia archaeon]|nr:hypothetical protein [Candidatus Bathyarchaeota archaeon]
MTHTNHRRGSRESLSRDFVILSMIEPTSEAQRTYRGPLEERVRRFLEICGRYRPVAIAARAQGRRLRYLKGWTPEMNSGIHQAASLEEVIRCEEIEGGVGHAVYADREAVIDVLRELREADLGLSIVVSGVFEEVFEACRRAGLKPHTVNMSLGTWGRTELLPDEPVLELCTMCGHAMISRRLAEAMIERVGAGALTPEAAAVELGKQCTCNIFNTVRGAEIIKKAVSERKRLKMINT